ncbi:hypothetical protein BDV96DRAFT_568819 [Lophiotrema nucula]|uniref:Uncharacterized protein n=1 Tax=Lophiotrema nucula TaxID=690887 RepID=A0A6A5ZIJ1_9PLEO|nr:hypothetical protein BDV96DRAFT_568819 [Lophiotrema nucula]
MVWKSSRERFIQHQQDPALLLRNTEALDYGLWHIGRFPRASAFRKPLGHLGSRQLPFCAMECPPVCFDAPSLSLDGHSIRNSSSDAACRGLGPRVTGPTRSSSSADNCATDTEFCPVEASVVGIRMPTVMSDRYVGYAPRNPLGAPTTLALALICLLGKKLL